MIETNIYKIRTQRAWSKLHTRLENDHLLVATTKPKRRYLQLVKWGIAVAALIACLAFGITFYFSANQSANPTSLIARENLEASTLVTTLEDGSIVYLTQKASLWYPEHFESGQRTVRLQGDAYFDIAGNSERPFMIETQDMRIKVLGTAFNVCATGKDSFSLSVSRGSVRVSLKKDGQEAVVKAGELLTVQNDRLRLARQENDAWVQRYLKNIRFKDERLENILRVVNLYSSRQKMQVSSTLAERRLTVEFSDHSPEVVAGLICLALNLKCTPQGDILLLSEK